MRVAVVAVFVSIAAHAAEPANPQAAPGAEAPPAAAAAEPSPERTATPTVTAPEPTAAAAHRILILQTRNDDGQTREAKSLTELLTASFADNLNAEVVAYSSLKDRLSEEADKMATGCDVQSCLVEIAGALDTRYVVGSRLTRVGSSWLLRVELFDSQDVRTLSQRSLQGETIDNIAQAIPRLVAEMTEAVPVLARGRRAPREKPPWVLGGIAASTAGVAAIGGVVASTMLIYLPAQTAFENEAANVNIEDPADRLRVIASREDLDDAANLNNILAGTGIAVAAGLAGVAIWCFASAGGE